MNEEKSQKGVSSDQRGGMGSGQLSEFYTSFLFPFYFNLFEEWELITVALVCLITNVIVIKLSSHAI